jgi:hypothetical protein
MRKKFRGAHVCCQFTRPIHGGPVPVVHDPGGRAPAEHRKPSVIMDSPGMVYGCWLLTEITSPVRYEA